MRKAGREKHAVNGSHAAMICCFTLGTVLLLSALFLVLYNLHADRKGGEEAGSILAEMKQELPVYIPESTEQPTGEAYDLYAAYEEPTIPETETLLIGDKAYIGYLSIPLLGIELPVAADWSYPALKTSPCRYSGGLYTDDLIIAAHNYASHFGRLRELHTDDELLFTDAAGKPHVYRVTSIEEIPGTAAPVMQSGAAESWDLTLFTCTLSGQSRVTIRAERVEQ